jgi:hypothetical protein
MVGADDLIRTPIQSTPIMASIQEGSTYKLVNVKSRTVIDLSGTDGYSSKY